jgi:3',5'-cyclic AMP phosphodiesterase CpdA
LIADLHSFGPDHVVITGDMTHIGLPCEFREVARWLAGVGTPEQVTLVPGNHDRYVNEAWDGTFARWAAYLRSDDARPGPLGVAEPALFPSLRVRNGIAFIGLSSARPSAPLLAVGSLGRTQLRALERVLAETGRRGLFRVLMLHHPPETGAVVWCKRLIDAPALRRIVGEQGAELVLHGHSHSSHRVRFETPAGRIPVLGVPSASAAGRGSSPAAAYHLHELHRQEGGWLLQTRVRAYTGPEKGFVAETEFEDFIIG